IEKHADGYRATGNLTIKDITRPLAIMFTLDITDKRAIAQGMATITREDFDLGADMGPAMVSASVQIALHIEADRP
ncbi:MAG: YceI family protein, partial [Pseudomonadota bacterium]